MNGYRQELAELVELMDADLDGSVADIYQGQPLAQDWARVAKVMEEAGEAIDALIGLTGQNPRKGFYGQPSDLHDELCDVALTAIYGLQHFVKDSDLVLQLLLGRARFHRERRSAQLSSTVGAFSAFDPSAGREAEARQRLDVEGDHL